MTDLRNSILDVIQQDEPLISPWLRAGGGQRTHAFLGSCHHTMKAPPAFNRYGKDGRSPCILSRVYSRHYAHVVGPAPAMHHLAEELPWFEFCGVDCWFLKDLRSNHGGKYPVEWEYDWLIEVENTLAEFAMHLRGLLDFVVNHRAGIFFCDQPDKEIERLTTEFLKAWKPFAARYSFANDLDLHAIFFPETYTTFQDYSYGSRTYIWNGKTNSFQRI